MTPDTSRSKYNNNNNNSNNNNKSIKRRSYFTAENSSTPIKSLIALPSTNSERTGLLTGQRVTRKITPIESIFGRKKPVETNLLNTMENSKLNSQDIYHDEEEKE